MNKKILFGSIILVVILVMVSFTGVVGYQTTKSNIIARASPLFSIRTSRAIGQGQRDITTDYLGHGEETNIHLTGRLKRAEQVQKVIDIISKMDDKAFSKFIAKFIFRVKYQDKMTDKEISNVLQTLYHIRINPNDNKYSDEMSVPFTLLICEPTLGVITCEQTLKYITCHEFPCIFWDIYEILFFIFLIIYGRLICTSSVPLCETYDCTV